MQWDGQMPILGIRPGMYGCNAILDVCRKFNTNGLECLSTFHRRLRHIVKMFPLLIGGLLSLVTQEPSLCYRYLIRVLPFK